MKVALVGSGESRQLAPFDDPEWQIWTYQANVDIPRYTLCFDAPNTYSAPDGRTGKFPAQDILKDFGPYWFTSALPWLFPFAMIAGATEIGVYGTQLSEYHRMAVHHWICCCEQLRIPVFVPEGSSLLLVPHIYRGQ